MHSPQRMQPSARRASRARPTTTPDRRSAARWRADRASTSWARGPSGGNPLRQQVFERLSALIQLRTRQPAFYPDNPMTLLESDNAVLLLRRHAADSDEGLLCVFNLSSREISTTLPQARPFQDVISGQRVDGSQPLVLAAWQFMWLRG